MKVGSKVFYDGVEYTIECDYGNGVYFIGNADSFVDLVNEDDMISMFCAETADGKRWMTLPEIESLGSWDYCNGQGAGFMHSSAVAALAAVASYGGYAKPSNGMDVTIREVDLSALLADMGRTGPTANDGNAS